MFSFPQKKSLFMTIKSNHKSKHLYINALASIASKHFIPVRKIRLLLPPPSSYCFPSPFQEVQIQGNDIWDRFVLFC